MIADFGSLTEREREVVLATANGASTQEVAGRLLLSPRAVEHHLSVAYRKLGVRDRSGLIALFREEPAAPPPATRYAASGGASIAYQVFGTGGQDVVLVPGFIPDAEEALTWQGHARFLRHLAERRRLIVFDKRGTGLSDPLPGPSRPTMEERMDEVRAVMDAAGSHQATLFGFSEGAMLSMLFATAYPSRTNGLILYGALIASLPDPGPNGTADVAAAPEATATPEATAAPEAAIDVRGLCAAIHAPCLVLHRRDDPLAPAANGQYLAENLPAVRYVELAGHEHPPWLGENERLLGEVSRFMTADRSARGRA